MVPSVFSFSSKITPTLIEKVDMWNPQWQGRINYKPHANRIYVVLDIDKENKSGQLHAPLSLFQSGFVTVMRGIPHP